jgi:release factor glutamine methyltransferase
VQYLTEHGVNNPRLDAEVLLADVLRVDRVGVYLNFDRPLAEEEVARYREQIRRRGKREPLQHIRGKQEFFSREFRVGPQVLVPRPETEIVVEEVLSIAHGMAAPRILDLGTGSGAIAVTLALELPQARLFAGDVSAEAVGVAEENAKKLRALVELRHGDLFAPFAGESFDIIVSNPPYVPAGDIESLAAEVRDFEPRLALDGGTDGLEVIWRLCAAAPAALVPGGSLVLEIGAGQRTAVESLFPRSGLRTAALRRDLAGIERVISARCLSSPSQGER